jgi:hypothetical protein
MFLLYSLANIQDRLREFRKGVGHLTFDGDKAVCIGVKLSRTESNAKKRSNCSFKGGSEAWQIVPSRSAEMEGHMCRKRLVVD